MGRLLSAINIDEMKYWTKFPARNSMTPFPVHGKVGRGAKLAEDVEEKEEEEGGPLC